MRRQVCTSLTTYRFASMLSDQFDLAGSPWGWGVGTMYQQNEGVQVSMGNRSILAVRQAGPSFLNAQGVVQCGAASNPIVLDFGQGNARRGICCSRSAMDRRAAAGLWILMCVPTSIYPGRPCR